jgi:hypothetical protein
MSFKRSSEVAGQGDWRGREMGGQGGLWRSGQLVSQAGERGRGLAWVSEGRAWIVEGLGFCCNHSHGGLGFGQHCSGYFGC